jgi:hypothetical protein
MIDMSALYEHDDYETALERFDTSDCKWSSFVDVHMKVSQNRCPICESPLDGSVTRLSNSGNIVTIDATVDHYRPQNHYSFLKCNHKNYLLMCSECNNIYKGSQFPLHSSTPTRATNEDEVKDEKPLIINPINDDLLELFILVFKRSGEELLLELKPRVTTGYLYEKAVETIRLFGLGNCEINRHQNDNVYGCRISILQSHFGVFYTFAKALNEGNQTKAMLEFRNNKERFESYGFYKFIRRKQFEIVE